MSFVCVPLDFTMAKNMDSNSDVDDENPEWSEEDFRRAVMSVARDVISFSQTRKREETPTRPATIR
jgi:hypothetical protein